MNLRKEVIRIKERINMANKNESEENLKGTLYLVTGVGIVIIAFWATCFGLFVDRF